MIEPGQPAVHAAETLAESEKQGIGLSIEPAKGNAIEIRDQPHHVRDTGRGRHPGDGVAGGGRNHLRADGILFGYPLHGQVLAFKHGAIFHGIGDFKDKPLAGVGVD